jgi:hypothetical protein
VTSSPSPRVAAALATTTLGGLAALHAAWGAGSTWPASTPAELGDLVVGPAAELPPAPAVWAVAGLLGAAAVLPPLRLGWLDARQPRRAVRVATWSLAGALLVRAASGFVISGLAGTDEPFHRFDLMLYSPLCTVLGVAVAVVARSEREAEHGRSLDFSSQ